MSSSTPTNKTVNIYINSPSAKKTLDDLQARADKFTDAIRKGEKAGKDMTDTVTKLGNTKAKIAELEQIISGKMAPSLTMVKNRANELRHELERMSADAPGYAAKFKEFTEVNTTLRNMQANVKGVGVAMNDAKKATSSFWKDAGKIALGTLIGNTVQAGLQAITGYISGIVSGNAKLSDSLADVQKATGLTAEEVGRLNSSIGKIDTRTTTADLREIAVALGQMGEAATPASVASFDKLVVALGDEFSGGVRETATSLGELRNNLHDIKTADYGTDMLHIGNALNILGAEGMATAPVVVDFANRMAGVAGIFKLTSGEILGLSATMQELGINVERGSTATIKILQKIAAEPAKFAIVAGQSVKDFTNLVNTDMAAAFNAVAVGAGKASGKNTEFSKVLKELDADGSGAGEVLSKLSKNQEMLASKTALATNALKGNSSIMEEFNTKNNNLAANLEKLSKNVSSWFNNSSLTNFINNFVAGMLEITAKTKTATESFDTHNASVQNLEKNIQPLLQRYDELSTNTNLSSKEQAEMKSIVQQVTAVMPGAVTQFDQYGNAIAISTNRVRDFIKMEKARLQVMNASAIEENKLALKGVIMQQIRLQKQKEEIEKTGTFQVQFKAEYGGQTVSRPATQKEIAEKIKTIQEVENKVLGYTAELRRLNGAELQDLADQQLADAHKAAEDSTAQFNFDSLKTEKEHHQRKHTLTMEELKKLSDDEISQLILTEQEKTKIAKDSYVDLNTWLRQAQNDWANAQDVPYAAALADYKRSIAQRKHVNDEYFANGIIDEERYNERRQSIALDDVQGRIALARTFAPQSGKAEKDLQDAITEQTNLGVENRKKRIKDSLNEIPQWVNDVISAMNVAADVSNVVGQAFDVIGQKEENEIKKQEARDNKKKANLDKQLAAQKISKAKYNKEISKMEDDLEAKRKKAAIAQFNRDKMLAISNAIINTVSAVMKAVAASPLTGGLPWSAVVGTIGAAQVAIAAGQKPPEFSFGGVLPGKGGVSDGPSHANGGIALMDPAGRKRGEIEGGEPILSIDTYRNNRAIVDALLDTSMNKGGASLGWLNNMGSRLNYQRSADNINFNRMYGNGGIVTPRNSSGAASNTKSISETEMILAMQAFTAQLQQGVKAYTYYNETDRQNNEIVNLKKMGSAKPSA
jgi:hypothetical protein